MTSTNMLPVNAWHPDDVDGYLGKLGSSTVRLKEAGRKLTWLAMSWLQASPSVH